MVILETDRLILRRLLRSDLDVLYEMYGDPETRRYFPDGVRTREETAEELEWFLSGHPQRPELGLWACVAKDTGEVVGRSGLLPWTIGGKAEVEVAYMISKTHWRRGLGSEVATGLIGHGFHALGLESLIALIDPDHIASIRTACKVGMALDFETVMHGLPTQVYRIRR